MGDSALRIPRNTRAMPESPMPLARIAATAVWPIRARKTTAATVRPQAANPKRPLETSSLAVRASRSCLAVFRLTHLEDTFRGSGEASFVLFEMRWVGERPAVARTEENRTLRAVRGGRIGANYG